MFPENGMDTICICTSGIGGSKERTSFVVNYIPDLNILDSGTQCFPLYYYEEQKHEQLTLFDEPSIISERYKRKDGITDWILKEIRKRYDTRSITKEDIFYYVYGLLHSEEYRTMFEADLKKSLPRIPIVELAQDFKAFSQAGRDLASLHLNYEDVEPYQGVKVIISGSYNNMPIHEFEDIRNNSMVAEEDPAYNTNAKYGLFYVKKMAFGKKDGADKNGKPKKVADKSIIIYNENICIENIPEKAYEYVVNGKSAIEWIMERYCWSQDSKSGIINDANDWSREHEQPRYILDLLLSIINVSVLTVDIIKGLPKLKF